MKNAQLARKRTLLRALIGFTLIEGMLMFTALGVAASLTFTRYLSFGSSALTTARASEVNNLNSVLEGFQQNGGTFVNAATGNSVGNATTNGVMRCDSATDLLADLATGAYAGGIEYQVATVATNASVWNGTAPTVTGGAALARIN